MTERRETRAVRVGQLTVGGGAPISVQSMTNTDPRDREATYRQVRALESAGCDLIRLAVPEVSLAGIFLFLKERGITTPLVADIHFDYKIALAAIAAGADKIRINPGNIGSREKVAEVVRACRDAGVPIRIGVNGGSLERSLLAKYGAPTAEAIAESALGHAAILEELGFTDIVLSVKSSDVLTMIEANRILAKKTRYPLHLGVTEAGGLKRGIVKGAIGIGTLLAEGIGDTVRVSLTADPVEEVRAAREILSSLGLDPSAGIDVISCPTCGRTKIDLIPLLAEFEKGLDERGLRGKKLKVAFMGCAVNGPGEAREADLGIAGGDGEALLFRHGETVAKYPQDKIVGILLDEIEKTDPDARG